jgi:hypothetical protein
LRGIVTEAEFIALAGRMPSDTERIVNGIDEKTEELIAAMVMDVDLVKRVFAEECAGVDLEFREPQEFGLLVVKRGEPLAVCVARNGFTEQRVRNAAVTLRNALEVRYGHDDATP